MSSKLPVLLDTRPYSVNIESGYMLGDLSSIPGKAGFLSCHKVQISDSRYVVNPVSYPMGTRILSPGIKLPEREANINTWSYNPTPTIHLHSAMITGTTNTWSDCRKPRTSAWIAQNRSRGLLEMKQNANHCNVTFGLCNRKSGTCDSKEKKIVTKQIPFLKILNSMIYTLIQYLYHTALDRRILMITLYNSVLIALSQYDSRPRLPRLPVVTLIIQSIERVWRQWCQSKSIKGTNSGKRRRIFTTRVQFLTCYF